VPGRRGQARRPGRLQIAPPDSVALVLAPRPTGPRRPSRWTLTALAIAATVAGPPLAVVSSLTQPAQGVWAHLWRTQLVELTLNTLALLAGVGLGTFVLGTALGWAVTHN